MKVSGLVLGLALGVLSQPAVAQASGMTPVEVARTCLADVRSLCAGVPRGGGRIIACLRNNLSRASSACQKALGENSSEKVDEQVDADEEEDAPRSKGGRQR